MPIKFKNGNLFSNNFDIRINTINCVGAMGKGIALEFKNRYPNMYWEYKELCSANKIKPGKMWVWQNLYETIINFPTKRHWKDNSRYDDIELGLNDLYRILQKQNNKTVAIPALGCGNGGLNWKIVSKMIYDKLNDLDNDITVFNPFWYSK
ncbi:MAG: macro domain-containing protein [Flavobacteriaceae bacterium]|nr:macro domain-containing protein [Flavobacteriaceae bacterium]